MLTTVLCSCMHPKIQVIIPYFGIKRELIATAWLHSEIVRVLDWSACSPELSPFKIVQHIMKCKTTETLNG